MKIIETDHIPPKPFFEGEKSVLLLILWGLSLLLVLLTGNPWSFLASVTTSSVLYYRKFKREGGLKNANYVQNLEFWTRIIAFFLFLVLILIWIMIQNL
jgi:hypothetical protein